MRVLLISANTEQINMLALPLGLSCVASAVRRAGHEVQMVDLMFQKNTASTVRSAMEELAPHVIGISVRNIDDQCAAVPYFLLRPVKEVIAYCRSFSTAPIILGGAGYSIFPESALAYLGADMGIQGEGETAFPALLHRLENKADLAGLPGLYLAKGGVQGKREYMDDLDAAPCLNDYLKPPSASRDQEIWIPVQTRRGCPFRCSYCTTPVIEGTKIRKHSAESVVEGMARSAGQGYHAFFFVDSVFNIPHSYTMELCERLTTSGIKAVWRSILYPHDVDEALVKAMARAGCREVSLGFESGSGRVLAAMNKQFQVEEVRRISDMLGANGINRMGFLLLGGPGETRETVEESLAFADSLGLEAMRVTTGIRIYPHTPLAKTARERGVLKRGEDLLFPRFYLEKEIDGWLQQTVKHWTATRPHWIT